MYTLVYARFASTLYPARTNHSRFGHPLLACTRARYECTHILTQYMRLLLSSNQSTHFSGTTTRKRKEGKQGSRGEKILPSTYFLTSSPALFFSGRCSLILQNYLVALLGGKDRQRKQKLEGGTSTTAREGRKEERREGGGLFRGNKTAPAPPTPAQYESSIWERTLGRQTHTNALL